jgi:hypothetical protein
MSNRIPRELKSWGELLVQNHLSSFNLSIMKLTKTKNKFGVFNVELRVKPDDTSSPEILEELQVRLSELLNERVVRNKVSPNSGKYSSLSFKKDGELVDLIVAKGANKGEAFEKELLADLQRFHMEGVSTGMVDDLMLQMQKVDPDFKVKNIERISSGGHAGARARFHLPPDQHGKIIADIVIEMNDGTERYLSVKNINGKTLANITSGVRASFDDTTFKMDGNTEFSKVLKSLGVDLTKVSKGLTAYSQRKHVLFDPKPEVSVKVTKGSSAWKFIEKAWGYNYFYVRQQGEGFKILNIDKTKLHGDLIKGLEVTRIYYPYKESKQLTVHISSAGAEYALEVRNPHGPGSIVPTDAKLALKRLKE